MQGHVEKESIWKESVSVWCTVRASCSTCFGQTLQPDRGMQGGQGYLSDMTKKTLLSFPGAHKECDFDYQGDGHYD